jgi:hypothetical protein
MNSHGFFEPIIQTSEMPVSEKAPQHAQCSVFQAQSPSPLCRGTKRKGGFLDHSRHLSQRLSSDPQDRYLKARKELNPGQISRLKANKPKRFKSRPKPFSASLIGPVENKRDKPELFSSSSRPMRDLPKSLSSAVVPPIPEYETTAWLPDFSSIVGEQVDIDSNAASPVSLVIKPCSRSFFRGRARKRAAQYAAQKKAQAAKKEKLCKQERLTKESSRQDRQLVEQCDVGNKKQCRIDGEQAEAVLRPIAVQIRQKKPGNCLLLRRPKSTFKKAGRSTMKEAVEYITAKVNAIDVGDPMLQPTRKPLLKIATLQESVQMKIDYVDQMKLAIETRSRNDFDRMDIHKEEIRRRDIPEDDVRMVES